MENLLQGIPNVVVHLNDILIAGRTQAEHFQSLNEVLSQLEKAGICLKRSKCVFQAPEVTYLGLCITRDGIYPLEEKLKVIQDSPQPTNREGTAGLFGHAKLLLRLHS